MNCLFFLFCISSLSNILKITEDNPNSLIFLVQCTTIISWGTKLFSEYKTNRFILDTCHSGSFVFYRLSRNIFILDSPTTGEIDEVIFNDTRRRGWAQRRQRRRWRQHTATELNANGAKALCTHTIFGAARTRSLVAMPPAETESGHGNWSGWQRAVFSLGCACRRAFGRVSLCREGVTTPRPPTTRAPLQSSSYRTTTYVFTHTHTNSRAPPRAHTLTNWW